MPPQIHYQISAPHPATHYLEIKLYISLWDRDTLDLKLPVWTPGSYLVREYARHVEQFQVIQGLCWQKVSKNHWQIQTPGVDKITVQYQVYANELSVRTNHLDEQHIYINGAATFLYIPAWQHLASELEIIPPDAHWQVTTALESLGNHRYLALDYDTLVDSPIEMGTHQVYEFYVQEISHQLAVWGKLNCDLDTLIQDIAKIIETEAALFGGLPYDNYLFILHLTTQGYGGLEHKNCCSLIYSEKGMNKPDQYQRFLNLVAHEFFHLWNVKRLKPAEFVPFDYDQENYTPSLWFCEGTTSYYDLVIPWRAGIYDAQQFLKLLGVEITRYYQTPGREIQSLSEASFDAWIKHYRRDGNSPNSQISYYLKGALVTLLLDLKIREKYQNQRSFDDVMQKMWQAYGQAEVGFTAAQLYQTIATVVDEDLTDFWQNYITGLAPLPLAAALADFGLELREIPGKTPFLGITLEPGRCVVKQVLRHSPAWWAGVDPGDELVALAGRRVQREQWSEQLQAFAPGQTVELALFRRDEWRYSAVTLAEPVPERYQIAPLAQPTATQHALGIGWLGELALGRQP
ncbi:peptidase M61 domain-containing protein [Gloeomargarita lithophora Alchichica-D10]|uniref:Peptidase M61 domain-containing protein n=1 Tax=Gloeomargarita lithophora Alchichica-D10 TaxID=1188229 RepID=A0A1J0A9M9_9CYAN|nr:M61 family metallopeptidase [Gloeomargarita lithophora]APB32621.1 peptidase M61 domain-containing protein [Gloeomargarita lithophora Alchichica-D10]